MLDLSFVREHLPEVEESLRRRGLNPDELLGGFRDLDARRRQAITTAETLKAERNKKSEEVGRRKRAGEDAGPLMEETKSLREEGERQEKLAAQLEEELRGLMLQIPNVPHSSVPVGRNEHGNVEVRRWGAPSQFGFTPKPHWELGEQLGILDLERAAKLSGARFAVYWDLGAKLERALANFMLDLHTREHGYTEVLPPFAVNSASMYGTGQLPKFANDLFKLQDHDLWLIPTAEVPLTNLHRDETLEEDQLPISITGYTPCFRSEAGSF